MGLNHVHLHWFSSPPPFFLNECYSTLGFSGGSDSKESTCIVGVLGSILGLGRSPGGGHGNAVQYSCLENPHGLRSLVGYSPWSRRELDLTEAAKHTQYYTIYWLNLGMWNYQYRGLAVKLDTDVLLRGGSGVSTPSSPCIQRSNIRETSQNGFVCTWICFERHWW